MGLADLGKQYFYIRLPTQMYVPLTTNEETLVGKAAQAPRNHLGEC